MVPQKKVLSIVQLFFQLHDKTGGQLLTADSEGRVVSVGHGPGSGGALTAGTHRWVLVHHYVTKLSIDSTFQRKR